MRSGVTGLESSIQVAILPTLALGSATLTNVPLLVIDECGLDAGLNVDHAALVDIADVVVLACSFDIQLFKHSVFHDRNPAFLGLRYVDEHLLLHVIAFSFGIVVRTGWFKLPLH